MPYRETTVFGWRHTGRPQCWRPIQTMEENISETYHCDNFSSNLRSMHFGTLEGPSKPWRKTYQKHHSDNFSSNLGSVHFGSLEGPSKPWRKTCPKPIILTTFLPILDQCILALLKAHPNHGWKPIRNLSFWQLFCKSGISAFWQSWSLCSNPMIQNIILPQIGLPQENK